MRHSKPCAAQKQLDGLTDEQFAFVDKVVSPWGETMHHSLSGRSGAGKSQVFRVLRQVLMRMGRSVEMCAYSITYH